MQKHGACVCKSMCAHVCVWCARPCLCKYLCQRRVGEIGGCVLRCHTYAHTHKCVNVIVCE